MIIMKNFLQKYILHIAFIQALLAMLGSLYFSEIMGFPPCVLCWYQRICMYPLVVILLIGILKKDPNVYLYALPFSLIGLVIAIYHNLLYYRIISDGGTSCSEGISCTAVYFEWLGFITIPFLSLMAFILITACLIIFKKLKKHAL